MSLRNIAFAVAAIQIFVAFFAVYSSSQDRLSDGACIGGIFGSLANMVILAAVAVALLVLAVRSFRAKATHPAIYPLLFVAFSSGIAILVGLEAGLRCTV